MIVCFKFPVLLLLLAAPSMGQHLPLNRSTAMPTGSPAPTLTPVPTSPSAAPTETTAPSPSPTTVPTEMPTGTPAPTLTHSSAPTDSPAPSPSPSEVPSYMPSNPPSNVPSVSPTDQPSSSPSVSPSEVPSATPSESSAPSSAPSVSSAPSTSPSASPSMSPSEQPSASPSAAPSVSVQPSSSPSQSPTDQPSSAPSDAPSMQPSISLAPSATPTDAPSSNPTIFHDALSTRVAVTFDDLDSEMTGDALVAFEETTLAFLQGKSEVPDSFTLVFRDVTVVDQTFIIPDRRDLAASSQRVLNDSGVRVRMDVAADIIPGNPPDDFSFPNTVSSTISYNFLEYMEALEASDPFFEGMAVAAASPVSDSLPSDQVGAGKAAGIVVGSFAALALAVGAGFYAIRHRDVVRARSVGSIAKDDPYMIGQCDSQSTDVTPYLAAGSGAVTMNPTSPNSLESGKGEGVAFGLSKSYSISSNTTKSSLKYSETSGAGVILKSLSGLDTLMSVTEGRVEEEDDGNLGSKHTSEVLAAHAGKKDPPIGEKDRKPNPPGTLLGLMRHLPESCFSSDSDLSPTAGEDIDTPSSNASSLSSFSRFLDNDGEEGNLGARPMGEVEQIQYRESHSTGSERSMKKEGAYDVFAPSGPLGIVVDTTKEGPIIHSMKSSSPLLGLMTAGDLIVGLDDMDTRGMTAATLTRIMAKRSSQKERKITLFAVETASSKEL